MCSVFIILKSTTINCFNFIKTKIKSSSHVRLQHSLVIHCYIENTSEICINKPYPTSEPIASECLLCAIPILQHCRATHSCRVFGRRHNGCPSFFYTVFPSTQLSSNPRFFSSARSPSVRSSCEFQLGREGDQPTTKTQMYSVHLVARINRIII